ncbi:MAG: SH3 domain-containing protein [Melioribacteraceae bacterium]
MKKLTLFFLAIGLILSVTSCDFLFGTSDTTIAYVVKTKKVNVREKPSDDSKIIGSFVKGDTLIPIGFSKKFIDVKLGDDTGFVLTKSLITVSVPNKVIANRDTLKLGVNGITIKNFLDEYITWKSLTFWGIALALSITTIALITVGQRLDRKLMFLKEGRKGYKKESLTPYLTALLGFLFGLLFVLWEEDVYKAIFLNPFWWFPAEKGFVAWCLWSFSLLGMCIVGYSAYTDVNKFGSYFPLHALFFIFLSTLSFITTAIITVATVYLAVGIVIAYIIFGFIGILTSPSGSGYNQSVKTSREEFTVMKKEEEHKEKMMNERMRKIWEKQDANK